MAESVEAALARIDESIKGLRGELVTKLDSHRDVLSEKIAHAASEAAQNLRLVEQRVGALEAHVKDLDGGLSVLETHLENRAEPLEEFKDRAKGALAVVGVLATSGVVLELVRIFTHKP